MGLLDRINQALEEAALKEQELRKVTDVGTGPGKGYPGKSTTFGDEKKLTWGPKKPRAQSFELVGYPLVWPPLDWDGLGLGSVRAMKFLPNKAVKIGFINGEWILTGSIVSSSILLFMAAGAGGGIYFLQDLIAEIEGWGNYISPIIIFLPFLANIFARKRVMKYQPYELEMLGYDSESRILVLSTITQPGGVVALRLDLPQDPLLRKAEEARIVHSLQKAHTGFTKLDGLASPDNTRFKKWTLWTLVWVVIFALVKYFPA